MKNNSIRKTVMAALFAALTFVATYISFPLPGNGYANLGDCFVIISGIVLGPYGIAAAALGSALCDLVLGYVYYAPATFIIKGIMAAIAFLLVGRKEKTNFFTLIISAVLCELVMIGGYFLFEIPLYGLGVATTDIIGNSIQALVGAVSSTVLYTILKKSEITERIKGNL